MRIKVIILEFLTLSLCFLPIQSVLSYTPETTSNLGDFKDGTRIELGSGDIIYFFYNREHPLLETLWFQFDFTLHNFNYTPEFIFTFEAIYESANVSCQFIFKNYTSELYKKIFNLNRTFISRDDYGANVSINQYNEFLFVPETRYDLRLNVLAIIREQLGMVGITNSSSFIRLRGHRITPEEFIGEEAENLTDTLKEAAEFRYLAYTLLIQNGNVTITLHKTTLTDDLTNPPNTTIIIIISISIGGGYGLWRKKPWRRGK